MRKNIIKLISFGTLAYFISFLGNIVLVQFYEPYFFGLFASFLAVTSMIQPILCLGFDGSISIIKKKEDVNIMSNFCIKTATIFSLLLLVHCIVFLDIQYQFILLGFFSVLFLSYNQILQILSNRLGKFTLLGFCRIQEALGLILLAILNSYFAYKEIGLHIAFVLNACIISFLYFRFSNFTLIKIQKTDIMPLLTRHIDFFKFNLLSNLALATSAGVHILLISISYSTELSGYVSFSQKFTALPYYLIGIPISQILNNFFLDLVEEPKRLLRLYMRVFYLLLLFSTFTLVVTFWFPEDLFKVITNDAWAKSLDIIKIFMFWGVAQLIGSTLSVIYLHLEKIRELFYLNILNIICTMLLFFLLNQFELPENIALIMLVTIKVLFYIAMAIIPIQFIRKLNA